MDTTTTLGTVRRRDGAWELHFERHLAHPPEKVWRAITESEHLAHWLPCDIVGERRAGADLSLPFWPAMVDKYKIEEPVLSGRIEVWDPPHVFEWRWDADRLRFEVDPDGDGTRLRFTTWIPGDEALAVDSSAGYHVCFDRLAHLVDTGTPAHIDDDVVKALESRYAEVVREAKR
jgi:uncharacterized protein YndB with AHSA1/START domain